MCCTNVNIVEPRSAENPQSVAENPNAVAKKSVDVENCRRKSVGIAENAKGVAEKSVMHAENPKVVAENL